MEPEASNGHEDMTREPTPVDVVQVHPGTKSWSLRLLDVEGMTPILVDFWDLHLWIMVLKMHIERETSNHFHFILWIVAIHNELHWGMASFSGESWLESLGTLEPGCELCKSLESPLPATSPRLAEQVDADELTFGTSKFFQRFSRCFFVDLYVSCSCLFII